MRIPRAYLENYSKSLNTVSEQSRRKLVDALQKVDYSQPIAEVRNQVIAIMEPACAASTDMTARIASDFYNGLRRKFGLRGWKAEPINRRDPEATAGAVRAFVEDLVEDKPVDEFIDKCGSRLDRETRLAANQCIAFNGQRDPANPRWARVPLPTPETYAPWSKQRGVTHDKQLAQTGTCMFCTMLASRGFVYHSADTADHAHPDCDCRIVPSWDKSPIVEGYDPKKYEDEWLESGFRPKGKRPSGDKGSSKGSPKFKNAYAAQNYLNDAKTLDELYKRADEVMVDFRNREGDFESQGQRDRWHGIVSAAARSNLKRLSP